MDLVSTYRQAGFQDDEIATHLDSLRQQYKSAGFTDEEVDAHFGIPRTPKEVPNALLGRIGAGEELSKAVAKGPTYNVPREVLNETIDSVKSGWRALQPQLPKLEAPETEKLAYPMEQMAGVAQAVAAPFMPLYDTLRDLGAQPIVLASDALRSAQVAMFGEERIKDAEKKLTQAGMPTGVVTYDDAKKMIDRSMLATTSPILRIGMGLMGMAELKTVGGLPKGSDIQEAAKVIGHGESTPLMEKKLTGLYAQKGILPAEVVHDAAYDPTIAQSILSSDAGDMPYGYQFHGFEATPEMVAELEATRARLESGLAVGEKGPKEPPTVSYREPYFQDTPKRGQPFKTDSPLNIDQPGDKQIPDYGMPIAEGFELKPERMKQDLREQLILEGKDVEYSEAQKGVLSHISTDEESLKRPLTLGRIYTGFLDRLFPISQAVKARELAGLTTENNPYELARLLAGWAGKADHFLNNGTFDFGTFENNGKSLKEVLEPIKDLNEFNAYIVASRAIELEGRGVEHGIDLDQAAEVLRQGHAKFEQPFRELVDYQNRLTQYLRDSGVLSEGAYNAMVEANKMYVPFNRVMGLDEKASFTSSTGSSLQAQNPISYIKGSGRQIINPVESVIHNTYQIIKMAERNHVGLKLVDMLRLAPKLGKKFPIKQLDNALLGRSAAISDALGEVGVKGDELAEALASASEEEAPGTVSVFRNGKRETYKVDNELAIAVKGLDVSTAGQLARFFGMPAETLRAGTVLTPEFWMRHVFRDFVYAFTTSKGLFTPIWCAASPA
jgi:hypothetical protein